MVLVVGFVAVVLFFVSDVFVSRMVVVLFSVFKTTT